MTHTQKPTQNLEQIINELNHAENALQNLGAAISIYGSARTAAEHPDYLLTARLAKRLSDAGFAIISGGGPGIMQAANKGAFAGKSPSVGLNIALPHEQCPNPYQNISVPFEYFATRKATFIRHSIAFIVLPGGVGTLDELFDTITLMQTRKIPMRPIILVNSQFWQGLIEWMKNQLLQRQMISPEDLQLIQICDDEDEILATLCPSCQNLCPPESWNL